MNDHTILQTRYWERIPDEAHHLTCSHCRQRYDVRDMLHFVHHHTPVHKPIPPRLVHSRSEP